MIVPSERDQGFTLVELIMVMLLMGIVTAAIGAAAIVVLRAAPSTQFRIEDARATRSLQTWLSYDVGSAPATVLGSRGGYDTTALAPNSCGGSGDNIAYIEWVEDDGGATRYVANYRLVASGSDFTIVRYTCEDSGAGFGSASSSNVTRGISDATCAGFAPPDPYAQLVLSTSDNNTPLDPTDDYDTAELQFCLVAAAANTGLSAGGGDTTEVLVSVSSRNPSEFF